MTAVIELRPEPARRPVAKRAAGAGSALAEAASFWLFVLTLFWAPFPLGSNRPWSWSLLVFLVAGCWAVWSVSVGSAPDRLRPLRRLAVPLGLASLALGWAVVQTIPFLPESWVHPVWPLAQDLLGRPLSASISIDPWRTMTEAMKLGAYVIAGLLAFLLSQRAERARRLLDALLIAGALYALYALILGISGFTQENVFYDTRPTSRTFAGPFVSPSNFATYMGLLMLCAAARLLDVGARTLVVWRGARQFAVTGIHFLFGAGALPVVCFILTFALLVASGSRAGFMASLAGMAAMIAFAGFTAGQGMTKGWAAIAVAVIAAAMAALFMVTGDDLVARFNAMARVGAYDETRILLWEAALRMIGGSPWLGLGLGSYEPAYPLYAERVTPFIWDKAHNDFLEFAAGLGLPAAIAWWAAILSLVGMCVRGVFIRRRDAHYAQLAVAATVLVAAHSMFDFSLQIPAISLTYAVILGLGVAQSVSSREREME